MRIETRYERVTAVGEALQASSGGHGHIIVLRLMKRALLVSSRQGPAFVQMKLGPAAVEYEQESKGGLITSRPVPQPRSEHGELFAALLLDATGKRPRNAMMEATRADLYRMARRLVHDIDQCASPAKGHDWYPDGWKDAYDLIKRGKQAPQQEADAEPEPPVANPRLRVLDVLDYVAEKLKADYDTVLGRIGKTRATLALEDERALLGLVGAAGGNE